MVPAQTQSGAPELDLKGGSLLVLNLTDGSMLSLNGGMYLLNGRPISCAELKVTAPVLFLNLGEHPPHFDADCRPAD
jgi:hypothetical protein